MSEENQEYVPGESYTETEQQIVTDADAAAVMEAYDPSADDSMMPYIPSTTQGKASTQQIPTQPQGQEPMQGFIDLDSLGSQRQQPSAKTESQQNPNEQYKQTLTDMQQTPAAPTELGAMKNLEILENAMGLVQGISDTTKRHGDTNRVYATDVALKALHGAISSLKEIEYWIPEGKEDYVPKLTQIAKPIVDALQQYTDTIERLK